MVVTYIPEWDEKSHDYFHDRHPWRSRGNIITIPSKMLKSPLNMRGFLRALNLQCKIVRHLVLDAHGNAGFVALSPGVATPVDELVRDFIDPCTLASDARLQVNSCNVACGTNAESIRKSLEPVFSRERYRPENGKTDPFEGVKLLFNTSLGYGFGKKPSKNGIAVEYNINTPRIDVELQRVEMDLPENGVPACD